MFNLQWKITFWQLAQVSCHSSSSSAALLSFCRCFSDSENKVIWCECSKGRADFNSWKVRKKLILNWSKQHVLSCSFAALVLYGMNCLNQSKEILELWKNSVAVMTRKFKKKKKKKVLLWWPSNAESVSGYEVWEGGREWCTFAGVRSAAVVGHVLLFEPVPFGCCLLIFSSFGATFFCRNIHLSCSHF